MLTAAAVACVAGFMTGPADAAPVSPLDMSLNPTAQDAAPAEPEGPKWSGSVNFGADLSRGNSKETNLTLNADATRETEQDRLRLKFLWLYSEDSDGDLSERKTLGGGQYDYFLGSEKRLYVYGAASEESDWSADLDLRWTVGGGGGYKFFVGEEFNLSADTGLSYVNENFAGGDEDDYAAVRGSSHWDWKLSESATAVQDGIVLQSLKDSDDTIAKVNTKLDLTIVGNLIGSLGYLLEFDHAPADNTKQTDHRIYATIGWTFGS